MIFSLKDFSYNKFILGQNRTDFKSFYENVIILAPKLADYEKKSQCRIWVGWTNNFFALIKFLYSLVLKTKPNTLKSL